MSVPHIKFIWGSSDVIRGRWYLGLVGAYGRGSGRGDGLAISVRGLVRWSPVLLACGWLIGAAALVAYWQRDPYNVLTYADAVRYPVQPHAIREKRGLAFIARASEAMRGKRWDAALASLQQGLAFRPHDRRARLLLAEIHVANRQPRLAQRALEGGLTAEYPGRPYLTELFELAEQGEDYGLIADISRRYFGALARTDQGEERRWLVTREFSALIAARRFEELLARFEATAAAGGANPEPRVVALLELQRTPEALQALAEWKSRPDADRAAIARWSARAHRTIEDFEAMERDLAELRTVAPADPAARIFSVVQQALAARGNTARMFFEDYVLRFGDSAKELRLMAEALADIWNLPLLERCLVVATERGFSIAPFQVLLATAQLQEGAWPAAVRTRASIKPASRIATPEEKAAREWTARLVDLVSTWTESAGQNVLFLMREQDWPLKTFRTTVDILRRADQPELARDVLLIARDRFPKCTWVAAQQLAVAAEIIARAPATKVAMEADFVLPAAAVFLPKLDAALAAEQWKAVGKLVRDARKAQPPPEWLVAQEGKLRLAEIRLAQAMADRATMLDEVAVHLKRGADAENDIIDLARLFHAKHDRSAASALVDAVIQNSPQNQSARRLVLEWRAKSAP